MTRLQLAAGALLSLVALALPATPACGEDLVTLSGKTYHDVRVVRVDPDGVTWEHEGGICKIDFEDCPEYVRRAYHFDPVKAAAYRNAQAEARKEADELARHDAEEQRKLHHARAQTLLANAAATRTDASTVFRRAASPAASAETRQVAADMQAAADKQAAAALAEDTGAFGDVHVLPSMPRVPHFLGPRPINRYMDTPGSAEFQADLHHSPGSFDLGAADSSRVSLADSFYQPDYSTRSYYEGLDRAAAFLSGVPLNP